MSEGYSKNNVLASYVHLHFGSNPEVARNLVESCRAYKEKLREGPRELFVSAPPPSLKLPPPTSLQGGGRGA